MKQTYRDIILTAHRRHPSWTADKIAEHVACSLPTVRRTIHDAGQVLVSTFDRKPEQGFQKRPYAGKP